MLLPNNMHPDQSVFYNGSLVLKDLQREESQTLLDLYANVCKVTNMTFSTFILCLDWLFLIDIAKLNSSGEVELCF
jgi:hypothetical protein